MGTTGSASDGAEVTERILTTPSRVRNRIRASESDISNIVLAQFIEDERAFIENYAQNNFSVYDDDFDLARSICTDRCAAKALLHIAGISAGIVYSIDELKIDKSDRAATKLSMARDIWDHAKEQLLLLKPASSLRPKSSTA